VQPQGVLAVFPFACNRSGDAEERTVRDVQLSINGIATASRNSG